MHIVSFYPTVILWQLSSLQIEMQTENLSPTGDENQILEGNIVCRGWVIISQGFDVKLYFVHLDIKFHAERKAVHSCKNGIEYSWKK